MVCIYCGNKTQITNSRLQKRVNHTWRRRECTHCHAVFTTEEAADLTTSVVVRRTDGHVQPFNRDKLFVSILKTVGHRKMPLEDAAGLTATVIAHLAHSNTKASLSPQTVANTVHTTLKRFDAAAAVQYTAYHKI